MILKVKVRKQTAIVQARSGSTRFPAKVLSTIGTKTVLEHVIEQVLDADKVENVIVATTDLLEDNEIVRISNSLGIPTFRGSVNDVLDRFYRCAQERRLDPVVRISADCPFIDPCVVDKIIDRFFQGGYDYVSNNIALVDGKWVNSTCNFPQGMVVEIASLEALTTAWRCSTRPSEREHVFPYVQFTPEYFRIANVINPVDLSHIRCTLDYPEDLQFLRELYKRIKRIKDGKIIHIDDIQKVVEDDTTILEINQHINFDEGYKKSVAEDRRQGFGTN